MFSIAAAFEASMATSSLDQDASHGPRRGTEKVAATLPLLPVIRAQKSQIRLMDESRGLQRIPSRFVGKTCSSQSAKFVVHERQQIRGGLGVTVTSLAKESGEMFGLVRIGHLMVF